MGLIEWIKFAIMLVVFCFGYHFWAKITEHVYELMRQKFSEKVFNIFTSCIFIICLLTMIYCLIK